MEEELHRGYTWLTGFVIGAEVSTDVETGSEYFLLHLGIISFIWQTK